MATNSSLQYTDDQLNGALALATADVGGLSIEGFSDETEWHPDEIRHLRRILSYLPDQQDEWQECEFSEIRKGDRVKRVRRDNFGTIETVEGFVGDFTDDAAWDKSLRKLLVGKRVDHSLSLYRIPAPVVHPDPEVNEFILDEDGDVWRVNSLGTHYAKHGLNVHPEYFAGFWTPAKVIADD